jgi:hypothetical protein
MTKPRATVLVAVGLSLLAGAAGRAAEGDDKTKVKHPDARQTAQAFLDAALAGATKEAAALGQPGQSYSREEKIKEFRDITPKKVAVVGLHADAGNALATTERVRGDKGREGPLVLTLVKKGERWLIRDVDLETEESAQQELNRFLKKHPTARPVPEKKGK